MSGGTYGLPRLLLAMMAAPMVAACGPGSAADASVPQDSGSRPDADGTLDAAAPADSAAGDAGTDAGRRDARAGDARPDCEEGLIRRVVWSEDFEAEPDVLFSFGAQAIEHESCRQAARCARYNLMSDRDDPLQSEPGNTRATIEVDASLLAGPETRGVIVAHDFRYDDAHWMGTGFSNAEAGSIAVAAKGGYYGMELDGLHWSQSSFYVAMHGGEHGGINLGDNAGGRDAVPWSGWEDRDYGWDGATLSWMSTGEPFGADGLWHRFELEVRYMEGGDHHRAQIRIDGHPAVGDHAPDGWFALPPEYELTRYTTSYTSDHNTDLSEDRTGTACGMQIDDMQVIRLEACAR